ncbi:hypothetical protein M0813_18528 [Anaeramoeba flamelloides]|uniref:Uncharacterized protein n=1 Tax=Anaeramoeba flamelloides TaxID=1746091 RepID=A0ABQ8YSG9_9EUKA|nr:hypothetical protein M0813_18528 [Anaeramoeba flamelloides]
MTEKAEPGKKMILKEFKNFQNSNSEEFNKILKENIFFEKPEEFEEDSIYEFHSSDIEEAFDFDYDNEYDLWKKKHNPEKKIKIYIKHQGKNLLFLSNRIYLILHKKFDFKIQFSISSSDSDVKIEEIEDSEENYNEKKPKKRKN